MAAIGVDVGTGSVRAFVFEADTRLGGVRLPYRWRVTPDGGVETDADALVALVQSAIEGALAAVPLDRPGQVAAVGISALWHTLLGVGNDDVPTTPVYAWSDTRATSAAGELRARLDADAVHARTGAVLHPSFVPARLLWLRQTEPVRFAATRYWLSLPEYLWLRLAGERRVDVSIAAGSGLLDQARGEWDAGLLDAVGVGTAQLSQLAEPDARCIVPRAGLAAALANAWPALRRAHWHIPVGDGACANIGSGCATARQVALSVGTSAALRTMLPGGYSPPPAGLWAYRFGSDGLLLGGAISNGGIVPAWLRRTLRLPADGAELDALLAGRPAAGHGLTMLPFLAGERSPDWPLDASAAIAGLRLSTSALDILQAGLEAVAYRLALIRQRLRSASPAGDEVVASGAAFEHLPYWAQLLADTFGEPIRLSTEMEASSRGAALIALAAMSGSDPAPRAQRPDGPLIQPDMRNHEAHNAARAMLAR